MLHVARHTAPKSTEKHTTNFRDAIDPVWFVAPAAGPVYTATDGERRKVRSAAVSDLVRLTIGRQLGVITPPALTDSAGRDQAAARH